MIPVIPVPGFKACALILCFIYLLALFWRLLWTKMELKNYRGLQNLSTAKAWIVFHAVCKFLGKFR